MIRFAPKIQQDAAPAIKIAKSNANTRSDIGLSDISTAAAESESDEKPAAKKKPVKAVAKRTRKPKEEAA